LAGGGEAALETALGGVMMVLGRDGPLAEDAPEREEAFDPELTACTEDLEGFCAMLGRPGAPRDWSLCLSGPPGTGKSGFARHLARRLGLPVLQKRASDLLSMWVGGSEKAIAAAFSEARTRGALLLLDEAEALLFDRGAAERSFEVSQVDEMLTWMESHPLPLVCTTNLPERMDRAVPRRFTLKLRFEAMDPVHAALAFRRMLRLEPPGPLPDGLTPGDFALVRRKTAILGGERDAVRLLRWLEEEAAAKGAARHPMGFHHPTRPAPELALSIPPRAA
jgi:SpoVK/Ycf46/Vps4 family AAA+-type ATPase